MSTSVFFVYSLEESNGTERAVINLANAISSEHRVNVISLVRQSKLPIFPVNERVILSDLGIHSSNKLIVYLISFFKMFLFLLRDEKRNNIMNVVGSLVYINIILSVISLFKHCMNPCLKFYGWEHAPYEHPTFTIRMIRRWSYRFLDDVICINNFEMEKFLDADGLEVKVVPNIVCVTECQNISIENKINNKELLFVGRFSHEKGIDLLLDILAGFFKLPYSEQYTINIIGDGELLVSAKDKVSRSHFSKNVTFIGKCDNVESFYSRSSLLLCTSRYESFGLVIVEAMNFGTPTISFNIGSGPSTIIENNVNGFLIEAFSIDSYVNALIGFLLDAGDNKEMYGEVYNNCINTAKKYSKDNILPIWMTILKR